jgi:hypothetical protein
MLMQDAFFQQHWTDEHGNPRGGVTSGKGLCLSWQHGPLGRGDARQEPNGCFVETVIAAVIGRLEFYQASPFACTANADAIAHLKHAAEVLDGRTRDREARQVEGTHEV